jgi:hypothetical protein
MKMAAEGRTRRWKITGSNMEAWTGVEKEASMNAKNGSLDGSDTIAKTGA